MMNCLRDAKSTDHKARTRRSGLFIIGNVHIVCIKNILDIKSIVDIIKSQRQCKKGGDAYHSSLSVFDVFVSDFGEKVEWADPALFVLASEGRGAFLGLEAGFAGNYVKGAVDEAAGTAGVRIDREASHTGNAGDDSLPLDGERPGPDRCLEARSTMGAAIQ